MAKHIGIVGCSAEGAALCYRTICAEAPSRMGEHTHPEITMHNHCLGEYMVHIRAGDYEKVGELMLSSARKTAGCGADFAICPDNTIHQAFDYVAERSPIPWLHIADEVAAEARSRGHRRLAVLGTKYLMTGPVYPAACERAGIEWAVPDAAEREAIDQRIFKELVNGVFTDDCRRFFNGVIQRMKERGCDAVALSCTEIPLIVDPGESPLPTLDSTRLLARAAVREALA